jgi:hypothetical protein
MNVITNWKGFEKINTDIHVGFVYKVTNLTNDRTYIGSKFLKNSRTKRLDKSWVYYKTSSKYVKSDIRLLGLENFNFEILDCYTNYEDLHKSEIELIKKYLLTNNCYNKNIGGRILMDDEVVAKIQNTFKIKGHPMKGKRHPNKGKHINSGHCLNKGKKYYNNGIRNILDFEENIDLTIWTPGMLRYQKTNTASLITRTLKEIEYNKSPKHCIICNNQILYKQRIRKTCSNICHFKSISIHHHTEFLKIGKSVTTPDELYITPKGDFKSSSLAAIANNVSVPTVRARCKRSEHVIKYNKNIPKEWSGKTWKELGWSYKLFSNDSLNSVL